jgi:propanol-preferring alcohol dehydrogenase
VCSPEEARRMLDVVAEHNISVKTNPFNGLMKIPALIELAHSGKMAGKGIIIVDEKQVQEQNRPGLVLV